MVSEIDFAYCQNNWSQFTTEVKIGVVELPLFSQSVSQSVTLCKHGNMNNIHPSITKFCKEVL